MESMTLEPLAERHVPLVSAWLATDLVARWWAQDPSEDAVRREWADALAGTGHGEVLIASDETGPVGLLQWYRLADEPDYVSELSTVVAVPPAAASIDYLVGVPAAIGTGVGPRIIAAGLRRVWAARPRVEHVLVPVAAGNRRSWRALEKIGFARIATGELTPDNPIDGREHVLYLASRPRDLR